MKINNDQKIDKLLKSDPLAIAEKITGTSYKKSESTANLGLALMFKINGEKEALLKEENDTYFGITPKQFVAILEEEGMKEIFHEEFEHTYPGETKKYVDYASIFFSEKEGLFLFFDTYGNQRSINGGNIYYNWHPNDNKRSWDLLSSGGFEEHDGKLIHAGSADVREGLRFRLKNMRAAGKFITPWVGQYPVWVLSYNDTHKYDDKEYSERSKAYDETIALRLQSLPENVKVAIAPAIKMRLEAVRNGR